MLYVCDEASLEEREAVEQHVGACNECAASMAGELRLHQMLSTLSQPADLLDQAGALLAQCRSELAEALDDGADSQRDVISAWSFGRMFSKWRMELAMHPALAATAFVIVGLLVGSRDSFRAKRRHASNLGIVPSPQVTVTAPQRISDQELQNLSVSDVQLVPDAPTGSPTVVVHLRTLKPSRLKATQVMPM